MFQPFKSNWTDVDVLLSSEDYRATLSTQVVGLGSKLKVSGHLHHKSGLGSGVWSKVSSQSSGCLLGHEARMSTLPLMLCIKPNTVYRKCCHYPCHDPILSGTGEFLKIELSGKLPEYWFQVDAFSSWCLLPLHCEYCSFHWSNLLFSVGKILGSKDHLTFCPHSAIAKALGGKGKCFCFSLFNSKEFNHNAL